MKEKVGVGIKENEIKAERAQDKEDLHCTLGKFSCACEGRGRDTVFFLYIRTFLWRVRFYSASNSLTE